MTEGEMLGYDESNGFVIRAASPKKARFLASEEAAGEGADCWTSPKRSTCRVLTPKGKEDVIITDFYGITWGGTLTFT